MTLRLIIRLSCAIVSMAFLYSVPALASDKGKPRKAGAQGDVCGYVLDERSHQPIDGVSLEVKLPEDLEPVKGSTTDQVKGGFFTLRAPLGTTTSRFASERLIFLSPLSILMGGAQKVEKFVNVSQLIITARKDGYKTFYGPVPVLRADSEKFRIWLRPILMTLVSESYPSYVDPGAVPGRIDDLAAQATSFDLGETLNFKVSFSGAPLQPGGHVKLVYGLSPYSKFAMKHTLLSLKRSCQAGLQVPSVSSATRPHSSSCFKRSCFRRTLIRPPTWLTLFCTVLRRWDPRGIVTGFLFR